MKSSMDPRNLFDKLEIKVKQARSVENVAQLMCEEGFNHLGKQVVLTRLYLTLPHEKLPSNVQQSVRQSAQVGSVLALLSERTPILTLMGSRGIETAWNSRFRSVGHQGIPLVSADFVQNIPMIASMMSQMGMHLVGQGVPQIQVSSLMGSLGGYFYVSDASMLRDPQGRLIIPAQDFVRKHGIKTVFGVGGSLLGGGFAVWISFLNSSWSQAECQRYAPLISIFKAAVVSLIQAEQIFDPLSQPLTKRS